MSHTQFLKHGKNINNNKIPTNVVMVSNYAKDIHRYCYKNKFDDLYIDLLFENNKVCRDIHYVVDERIMLNTNNLLEILNKHTTEELLEYCYLIMPFLCKERLLSMHTTIRLLKLDIRLTKLEMKMNINNNE